MLKYNIYGKDSIFKNKECLKKRKGILILFYLLFLLNPLPSFSTNFPLINSAYKYDPASPIHCKYKIASLGDSVHLYLKIETLKGNLHDNYSVGYELKEYYGEKSIITKDSLQINDFLIVVDKNISYLKIPLKIEDPISLLLLSFQNSQGQKFYFDIPVGLDKDFPFPNLLLMNAKDKVPVFDNYVSTQDSIFIALSFADTAFQNVFFYQYRHEFSPALPPMATGGETVSKSMEIDSIFNIPLGKNIRFSEEALFFVQLDTASLQGISFRTVPSYFPRFKKVEELVNPLIYISTKGEMTRLTKASNQKKALDKYWLDLISTPSRAKITIKSYYDQVEKANQMFTTYKEGWKTDQGIIYILYGPPDEVYFNGEEEQWIYQKNSEISRLKFTFAKIKNIFTDQHFELLRSKSYEKYWFGNVELWRKGIKDL